MLGFAMREGEMSRLTRHDAATRGAGTHGTDTSKGGRANKIGNFIKQVRLKSNEGWNWDIVRGQILSKHQM